MVDLRLEHLPVALIGGALAGQRTQPFLPGMAEEQPLLRVATEELLGDDRFVVVVPAFENAQFVEQSDEGPVLLQRRGKVMRSPWTGDPSQHAALRCPAWRRLELEQDEIVESGAMQAPRGRQPGDAAPNNDDPDLLPAVRRGYRTKAVTQAMTYRSRRADDAPLCWEPGSRPRASRCEGRRQPQKRGQEIAARQFHPCHSAS